MSTPWAFGWQGRVKKRIAELGFGNFVAYINARPGKTFGMLAKELSPCIAPVQIEMLYLRECKDAGNFLEAAAECLARSIIESFPKGWGTGVRLEYRIASTLAAWISDMQNDVEQSELEPEALTAIADALEKIVRPSKGWLPTNGKDPLIKRAFELGLQDQ